MCKLFGAWAGEVERQGGYVFKTSKVTTKNISSHRTAGVGADAELKL
jgi:hypothetical protein